MKNLDTVNKGLIFILGLAILLALMGCSTIKTEKDDVFNNKVFNYYSPLPIK